MEVFSSRNATYVHTNLKNKLAGSERIELSKRSFGDSAPPSGLPRMYKHIVVMRRQRLSGGDSSFYLSLLMIWAKLSRSPAYALKLVQVVGFEPTVFLNTGLKVRCSRPSMRTLAFAYKIQTFVLGHVP
jgi:hypothetical protein